MSRRRRAVPLSSPGASLRVAAAAVLFAYLRPSHQALMLRHVWRLIPKSQRGHACLIVARPFAPESFAAESFARGAR